MLNFKPSTRKNLERNIKLGRWVPTSGYDPKRDTCLVAVAKANKTKPAGRLICIEVCD